MEPTFNTIIKPQKDIDWDKIPERMAIEKVMTGMKKRNFNPSLVSDKKQALEKLYSMIPAGYDVATGSSTTLIEIGFIDYLSSGKHPWQNWKEKILAKKDPEKQADMRRLSTTAAYFCGSVQAVSESGQVLGTDATGSRQGGYVFSAKNVVWVVGVNKIVSDLSMAFRRLHEHCVPLEDARMKKSGAPGKVVGKMVVYEFEFNPARIYTILVGENLGF